MNQVYQEVSDIVDNHYYKKRIVRYCGASLIEMFEIKGRIPPEETTNRSIVSKDIDKKIEEIISSIRAKEKNGTSDISQFDNAIDKIISHHKVYFKDCENKVNDSCADKSPRKKMECSQREVTLYFNKIIKTHWLFNFLDEKARKQINNFSSD